MRLSCGTKHHITSAKKGFMSIFSSERQMQTWLSNVLRKPGGLSELIKNAEDINDLTASGFAEAKILHSVKTALPSLNQTVKIAEDENISDTDGKKLMPDFVLFSPETQCVIVVELKNLIPPSRQAGTELAAYSSAIRGHIPLLAEGDVVHVLISSQWPTLLLHYARDQILWQGRNLICLRPTSSQNDEIFLEIVSPSEIAGQESENRISPDQLGGYQICLYSQQRQNLDHVGQFKAALQVMANEGNRLRSHGFAYLWRDHADFTLAPYSITCMNVAPLRTVGEIVGQEKIVASRFADSLLDIQREFTPMGHGQTLLTISQSGSRMVENVCSPQFEGFALWSDHRIMMQHRAEKISFVSWGIFGEAFFSELQRQYRSGKTAIDFMCPTIGDVVIEQMIETRPSVISAFDEIASTAPEPHEDKYCVSPPTCCDLCGKQFASEKYFVDGKKTFEKSWAFMCGHCFELNGAGIGWGLGQLYLNRPGEGWLLVGGGPNEANDSVTSSDPFPFAQDNLT
jgi:hypothetical protein